MSDDKEKKVKRYMYGEIARLNKIICEMDDYHYTELKTWTYKCGQMGNVIGSLRKQLAERNEQENSWHVKYDRLQKQLSVKEAELLEVNADLEHAQWENLKLKQRLEKKELDYQTLIDKTESEIEALRRQIIQWKEEEIEIQAEVLNVEVETDSTLNSTSINNVIMASSPDVSEITIENGNSCERRHGRQMNELEADSIVKTYYSSESEMDGEKVVNEPADATHLVEDAQDDLAASITEPVQHGDDTRQQKAKSRFWTTLKKRVSIKGKLVKPVVPLTSKVSENDGI